MSLFHRKTKDPKELAKEAKRATRAGERDIEKEIRHAEKEEKKLIADIKKSAKSGNERATKILAKQLIALRQNKERLMASKGQIAAVGHQTTMMASQANMAKIMGNVAGTMGEMNKVVSPEETAKIMQQFAVANERMGLSEEMMDDALMDAFDTEGAEEEADGIVSQVLDEIGIDVGAALPSGPTARPAGAAARITTEEEDSETDAAAEELMKKLQAL